VSCLQYALPALVIAFGIKFFVANPLQSITFVNLLFVSLAKKSALISWVGLRGGSPIVLAIFPVIVVWKMASLYFTRFVDIAFHC